MTALPLLIDVLRRVKKEMLASEIAEHIDMHPVQIGTILSTAKQKGNTSIGIGKRIEGKKNRATYFYIESDSPYFRGWRDPVTGIQPPRLGL